MSRYKHSLKEQAIDIRRKSVSPGTTSSIRGWRALSQVLNPERASYGIGDYTFGITQLAQTTLRGELGKIELNRP
jgi:hypothetical protein